MKIYQLQCAQLQVQNLMDILINIFFCRQCPVWDYSKSHYFPVQAAFHSYMCGFSHMGLKSIKITK